MLPAGPCLSSAAINHENLQKIRSVVQQPVLDWGRQLIKAENAMYAMLAVGLNLQWNVPQPAYQDADSTATALQAAAPTGVTDFRTERLLIPEKPVCMD
jgi:hypothetical protein